GHTLAAQFTPSDSNANAKPAPVSRALTVNKAPLTITANDKTMTYGGTVPAFDATYSGLLNGDTITSIVPGNTPPTCGAKDAGGGRVDTKTPAGTYPITCANAGSHSYSIS